MQPDTQRFANNNREPSVLCLLDHVLGNMLIHYSKTRVVHPRQGLDDILEIVKEENLILSSIKLIYLLVGRVDSLMSPGSVICSAEKVLKGFSRLQPRVMTLVGGIVILPQDSTEVRANITEINKELAKLIEKEHHWAFFNPNISVSIATVPERRYFDREGKLNKAGCRLVAQGLVATSKAARMLQGFSNLPPKSNV